MNSIAADFLSNLLASQTFRIWGKDSGAVTDEHVKIFMDERTSVMGETTQEDRAERGEVVAGEQRREQGTGDAAPLQGEGIVEHDGNAVGEDIARGESTPPVERESTEGTAQQQSIFGSDPRTSPPSRARTETQATRDGISDNRETMIPGGAQSSPTPPISPSDPQAESSRQADSAVSAEEASGQAPSVLPEDDGMRALRERVLRIQIKDITTDEKARLMHELLTEGYTKSQINLEAKLSTVPPSPATIVSQEQPTTPASISSFNFWPGKDNSPEKGDSVTFHLSQDDLKPTYAPLPPPVEGASDGSDEVEQVQVFGCEHYKRNVKLQCFTCNKWYTCRLCHDAVEDHTLPRRETKNMLCMICGTAQRAAEICTHCTGRAANYYCDICHLWEDDPNRSIYHCNDCGICRVGMGLGKDFFHCKVSRYFFPQILLWSLTFHADMRPLHEHLHGNVP
jgi:uncharacterized CHY-type Zn-finger protein